MLSSGWVTRYREMYPTIPIFYFSLKKGMWHAEPTLPLIGLPWQHSNASQSGWVFVPRKAVLIWHKHIMDNAPAIPIVSSNAPAQPRPYSSMCILDIDASTDTTEVLVPLKFLWCQLLFSSAWTNIWNWLYLMLWMRFSQSTTSFYCVEVLWPSKHLENAAGDQTGNG